jgi:hypothetical protein
MQLISNAELTTDSHLGKFRSVPAHQIDGGTEVIPARHEIGLEYTTAGLAEHRELAGLERRFPGLNDDQRTLAIDAQPRKSIRASVEETIAITALRMPAVDPAASTCQGSLQRRE